MRPYITSDRFSVTSDGDLVAGASDLGSGLSLASGFTLLLVASGGEVNFAPDHGLRGEDEVDGWVFQPADRDIAAGGLSAIVFND
jgi:hypothetical protein